MLAAAARKQEEQARAGSVARLMRRLAQALTPRWPARAVPVWRPAAALLALAVVVAIGWAAFAAPSSLPGDLFYPLKQAAWQVRLDLTQDPAAQQALQDRFEAEQRRDVAVALEAGQQASVFFSGQVESMEAGHWLVGGLPVAVAPDTPVTGQPRVGAQVQVHGELPGDGSLKATWIEAQADDAEVPAATPTPTATATATPSPSPTRTRVPDTPQPSDTPEPIGVVNDTPVPSETPEPTATNAPAPTATDTPAPEETPEPDSSPEPTGWPTGVTPPSYTPEPRDPVSTPEETDTPEPEETDEPEETPEVEETHQAPSMTPRPTEDDDD
jgi:hypothetical protein